jgi:hypothetical protein
MKNLSLEKIWGLYDNKYKALNVASLEARKVLDAMNRGELQMRENMYSHSLGKLLDGEIKYEALTEAEMEAVTREGYGEDSGFGRPV